MTTPHLLTALRIEPFLLNNELYAPTNCTHPTLAGRSHPARDDLDCSLPDMLQWTETHCHLCIINDPMSSRKRIIYMH